MTAKQVQISVNEAETVSGLAEIPAKSQACYVFAHGAGAGMHHSFMEAVAGGLAERGLATLRYQFPYMEKRSGRPDSPKLAHATVRAAAAHAASLMPGIPLFAGGKSFGGRMTSQAQALEPLVGVKGLIFLGFPLHPAGAPSVERAKHLADVKLPMLFLQGTRDELARLELIQEICGNLRQNATLRLFDQADHSFHVPARSGRKDPDVLAEMLDFVQSWSRDLLKG